MDRAGQLAAAGFTASTGTAAIQAEKRIDLLDIDMFAGLLSFNVPIGNVIIIIGVALSAYAAYKSYLHTKEKKRRKGDRFIDDIVKGPYD